jgi:ABC-2 type transport system ATP-binding protein
MDSIIQLTNLTKKFDHTVAVDNVTLSINKGEMFSMVGPDGAGKTTIIRMLCGIISPTSGSIKILGYDPAKEMNEIKKQIGYLSQKFSLYGDLTIDENIEFFAEIHKVRDYKPRRTQLLDFMRLTPFRGRLADRLSGGMKQKLALACTLVHTPQVLLLDEPTTGVDPVSRRDFWKILSELLKSGITIIMTTPYLDEAERCNRVCMLNEGKIMVTDTPDQVKQLMKGTVVELITSEIRHSFSLLKQLDYITEVQIFGDRINVVLADKDNQLPQIESSLKNKGITVTGRRVIPPTLENVFISLMKT